jgi:regulator of protease activity HflC (stomatin/prohibitin superfamily)
MESLFSWVANLINFFGQFIPRLRICRKNFKGIKYVRGKNLIIIKPGLFMYWPLTTEYELVPTATQILNLSVQTLLTADNKSIVCDGCICFKVVDVTKFLVDNFDSVECLNQLSLAAIRNVMISHTFEELKYVRQSIDDDLTEEAKNLIEDQFGVDIQYVKLVSLSSAKVINLVGGLTNANTLYNNSNSNIIGTI